MTTQARPERASGAGPELAAPLHGGIELRYQCFGDPAAEPLLLVMGVGGPMNWWPEALCLALAERGFHVVRYDNRDTGRSTVLPDRVNRGALVKAFLGRPVRAPYGMADLARDATGLMDHLGWETAHVAGVSMGGMIAQTIATDQAHRLRSLTSVMSTTGRRTVGWQDPRLLPALIGPRRNDRDGYVEGSIKMGALIGSPSFPQDPDEARARAEETWERGMHVEGVMRHMLAVVTQPDRTNALRSVRVPTFVMHGTDDRMVHVSGGRATAAAVPDAELLLVEGMGHDLPPEVYESLADGVRRTADRAARR